MTNIYAKTKTLRSIGLLTLSLGLAAFITSVQAADSRQTAVPDPQQTPVSNVGAIPGTGSAITLEGVMPFLGTGQMTAETHRESTLGLIPSREEIRALRPAESGIGVHDTVIGTDTRFRTYTTAYPARAIALITFTGGYCTGWFYGPNVVATAGHCVHSGGSKGDWRANVRVWPAYDAGSAPYGSYPAKWLASVVGWTVDHDERFDYGVIRLSADVGNTVGYFGLVTVTGIPSVIAGYPADKSPTQSQWLGVDQIRATQERQVFYKNDTFDGMSGSAVWEDRPPGSPFCGNGPCAYAIHAYGLHGSTAPHSDHNHGTRIVIAVFDNLIHWRDAP